MAALTGIPMQSCPYLTAVGMYQYRYPKSKAKRIRKKYARKYRREGPVPTMYMFQGMLMAHPFIYRALRIEIAVRGAQDKRNMIALAQIVGKQFSRNLDHTNFVEKSVGPKFTARY